MRYALAFVCGVLAAVAVVCVVADRDYRRKVRAW
jgi:hypothetical protein